LTQQPPPPPYEPPQAPARGQAFDQELSHWLAKGWRIESRTTTSAVLVKGKPVNHVLHLLLSLVTVGLWIPVWILLTIAGGEKRKRIAG
jgi:hypothetical protein